MVETEKRDGFFLPHGAIAILLTLISAGGGYVWGTAAKYQQLIQAQGDIGDIRLRARELTDRVTEIEKANAARDERDKSVQRQLDAIQGTLDVIRAAVQLKK